MVEISRVAECRIIEHLPAGGNSQGYKHVISISPTSIRAGPIIRGQVDHFTEGDVRASNQPGVFDKRLTFSKKDLNAKQPEKDEIPGMTIQRP